MNLSICEGSEHLCFDTVSGEQLSCKVYELGEFHSKAHLLKDLWRPAQLLETEEEVTRGGSCPSVSTNRFPCDRCPQKRHRTSGPQTEEVRL